MIAIIGAGGHGKSAYECLVSSGEKVAGFFDDDPSRCGKEVIDGKKVLGLPSALGEYPDIDGVFVAIGDNRARREKFYYYRRCGYRLPQALHPRSHISPYAAVGKGLFLMGTAVINPAAVVGDNVIINTNATVGHDCILENSVQVAPGANIGGGAVIGEGAFIGIGARVAPQVKIGAWSIIGAGAVVLEDVPAHTFYAGVPARFIRKIR